MLPSSADPGQMTQDKYPGLPETKYFKNKRNGISNYCFCHGTKGQDHWYGLDATRQAAILYAQTEA